MLKDNKSIKEIYYCGGVNQNVDNSKNSFGSHAEQNTLSAYNTSAPILQKS